MKSRILKEYLSEKMRWLIMTMLVLLSPGAYSQDSVELSVRYVRSAGRLRAPVHCDSFENVFKDRIREKQIVDPQLLENLLVELRKLRYEPINELVDVRSKFIFTYPDRVMIVCFDGSRAVLVNGRRIRNNPRLTVSLLHALNQ